MTALPAEVTFGKVVGRWRVVVGDSVDPGSEPDAVPAKGTVKFTPRVRNNRVLASEPVTVTSRPPIYTLDADGRLVDSAGNLGVWLLTGIYDVTFTLKNTRILPLAINVTDDYTEEEPLDMAHAIPLAGAPLGSGQYAELSHRIENIGGGGTSGGGYLDHGDQSGAVTYSASIGTHALTMTGDTAVTLTGGSNGSTVSIWATGPFPLTVEGITVSTGECVATMVRDVWEVRIIGGAGVPVDTGDTTAPSAVASVTASAVTDSSATLTWTAATDAESTVSYAYRVYPTGGTVPAYSTGLTATSVALTDLTQSEAYTAQVYAYSTGGSSAVASTTFATLATQGWLTVLSDDFTAADGTTLVGRVPAPVSGGQTWTAGTLPVISGGRLYINPPYGNQQFAQIVAFATGSLTHRVSVYLIVPPTGNGETADVIFTVGAGGFSPSFDPGNTYYRPAINFGKPALADTTLTISGTTTHDGAIPSENIVMEPGKSATGFPLTGRYTVEASSGTIKVYVDSVLWATVTPHAGATLGGNAGWRIHPDNHYGGPAWQADNLLIEAWV